MVYGIKCFPEVEEETCRVLFLVISFYNMGEQFDYSMSCIASLAESILTGGKNVVPCEKTIHPTEG